MSGYHLVQTIHKVEEQLDMLGFMLCYPKHGMSYDGKYTDIVAIKPKEDSLPIYARDAELFCGTIEDLEQWIKGVQWARDYDQMLIGPSVKKQRERKEQDYRNQRLMAKIKQSDKQDEVQS